MTSDKNFVFVSALLTSDRSYITKGDVKRDVKKINKNFIFDYGANKSSAFVGLASFQ